MFPQIQVHDVQETRRVAFIEGRVEGREELLKELYLSGSISREATLNMLQRNPRADELLQEWEMEKQNRQ